MDENKILVGEVDVRGLLSVEDELEKIESFLKENNISQRNILYTGICGSRERVERVLKNGIAGRKSNISYAQTKEEILINAFSISATALDFAVIASYENPAIAIYDATYLEGSEIDGYEPIKGKTFRDALIAIIHLKTFLSKPIKD